MQQGVQRDTTSVTSNNVASVCTGLYVALRSSRGACALTALHAFIFCVLLYFLYTTSLALTISLFNRRGSLFEGMNCKSSCSEDDVLSCSQNGAELITKSSVREIGKPIKRKGNIEQTNCPGNQE